MQPRMLALPLAVLVTVTLSAGCGSGASGNGAGIDNPLANPADGVPAGNPDGTCAVPDDAKPEDVSAPTT